MELTDEAAMLASNVQNMSRLHDALGIFNESFAGYLYALRMNAFCVEWPEVSRCCPQCKGSHGVKSACLHFFHSILLFGLDLFGLF